MVVDFGSLPKDVIDYIRKVFAQANKRVSATLTAHPGMHEEGLDQLLVAELSASPPAFLSASRSRVLIESHWLGGRRMFGRWEIADIAFFVMISVRGKLFNRKVALLQTKRLYATEFSGAEIDRDDYRIGVGRLVERSAPAFPFSSQRTFRFDKKCRYGALEKGSKQVAHVNEYVREKQIPVYYGLYNPMVIPHSRKYPNTAPIELPSQNVVGTRVIPSPDVHGILGTIKEKHPSFADLSFGKRFDASDAGSVHGWRLERFVADEVMKCSQGKRFHPTDDPGLGSLLYERSAPLASAIAISIDVLGD